MLLLFFKSSNCLNSYTSIRSTIYKYHFDFPVMKGRFKSFFKLQLLLLYYWDVFFFTFFGQSFVEESDHFLGSRGHMAFRSFNVCEEYKHQMTVFSSASTKNPVKEPLTFEHQQQNQHY